MENISKIVLTSQGKRIGYVLDVAVDFEAKKKSGYFVVDEESEGEFFLQNQNILFVSKEYLLIENEQVLEFVSNRKTIFGKEVLDETCQSLGHVNKLIFKKEKLDKLTTELCEISSRFLQNVGDDFVFVQIKRKRRQKGNRPEAFAHFHEDFNVSIQSSPIIPEKVRLSSAFYIGKISSSDIMGYNNEIIIKKGEVVTRSIVEKAKRHNRLNQLFFAVKREVV